MSSRMLGACTNSSAQAYWRGQVLASRASISTPFSTRTQTLADIARLEIARIRAYHSGDTKRLPRDVVMFALASGERMGELRLVCHPSVSVIASKFATSSLWAAHQGEGDLGLVEPYSAESALVVRQDLAVLAVWLQPDAAEFIAAIQSGIALGEAAGIAVHTAGNSDLTQTLGHLMTHGALTSIHLPQRLDS